MKKAIATLPDELVRSVTWNQGSEMSNHRTFTVGACRSTSAIPIIRPTLSIVRQYIPKVNGLSKDFVEDLRRIQRSLNGRPRSTLGYMTPMEKFAEIVTTTG
jgi:IS30 family transposase